LVVLFAVVFVAGFFVVGGQGAVNALSASYYPTDLRSTGVGSGLGVGRIGGNVGSYCAGAVLGAGLARGSVFFTAAVAALISAITMLSLRSVMKPEGVPSAPKSEVLAH